MERKKKCPVPGPGGERYGCMGPDCGLWDEMTERCSVLTLSIAMHRLSTKLGGDLEMIGLRIADAMRVLKAGRPPAPGGA